MADICRRAKVSWMTVYRWSKAYRDRGWKALRPRSTTSHNPWRVLTDDVLDCIRDLREAYGYDKAKIALLLAEEGIHISASSLYNGLEALRLLHRDISCIGGEHTRDESGPGPRSCGRWTSTPWARTGRI